MTKQTKTPKAKTPRAKTGETSARVAALRCEAFEMLKAGYSCPQIGEKLGVCRQRAYQLVSEELDSLRAETKEAAVDWRLTLTARHESRLLELSAVAKLAAREGDIPSIISTLDKQRAIDSEIAKLWGAHAPTKSELSGPRGGPIQQSTTDLSKLTTEQLLQFKTLVQLTQD